MFKKVLIANFLIIIFTACSFKFGGSIESKSYFVLGGGLENKIKTHNFPKRDISLLINSTLSNRFLNSGRIIYSNSSSKRQSYQYSYWVEPLTKRFSFLLMRYLEKENMFKSVTRRSSSAIGDIQLNTEIVDFYHDTKTPPGKVIIVVYAELLDLTNFRIIANREFKREVEVKTYNIDGAVNSFGLGVNKILGDITSWINKTLDKK